MVHARQPKPQPFQASTTLSVLSLDEADLNGKDGIQVPNSTSGLKSQGSEKMPTSFQGFEVKTDVEIRKQAKKSWFDLNDDSSAATTPFVSASPFEGISGNIPAFPPPSAEEAAVSEVAAPTSEEAEEEPCHKEEQEVAGPSPATPTRDSKLDVAEAPLKPGEEDADGAEGFEEQQQAVPQSGQLPTYGAQPSYPSYPHYQQPPQFGAAPSAFHHVPQQYGGRGFRSHHHQEQTLFLHQMPPPPPPQRPSSGQNSGRSSTSPEENEHQTSSGSISSHQLTQRPANHELMGFLPFYKFDKLALDAELPSADALGAVPQQFPKIFLGHVWSKVPTGVVQWLMNSFGPSGSTAFGPQLHFNREGWFRGCLHCSVATQDPQALIYALHKRVLFDHEGVWFAETADQMRILDDYCRRLRALPQQIRHAKLQSLPCNPLACELARNE